MLVPLLLSAGCGTSTTGDMRWESCSSTGMDRRQHCLRHLSPTFKWRYIRDSNSFKRFPRPRGPAHRGQTNFSLLTD